MRKLLLLFILYSITAGKELSLVQDSVNIGNNLIYNQKAVRDHKGKLHIVSTILKSTTKSSKEIFYSEESPDSFKNFFITSNNVEDNFPFITIDDKNIVHIAFLEKDSSGLFQIKYTNNSKGKFFSPYFITSGGLNKSIPSVAVAKDVVYFLYYTDSYLENGIYYCSFDMKSNRKTDEKLLGAAESGSEMNSSIIADSKGTIHVFFKSGFKDGGELKYFSGNGTLKEIKSGIYGNIIHPNAFIGQDSRIHIFFERPDEHRLYYTFIQGNEFSEPLSVTPELGDYPDRLDFSSDKQGNLYIAYSIREFDENAYYVLDGKGNRFDEPIHIYTSPEQEIVDNSINICSCGKGEIELLISETFKSNGKSKSITHVQKGSIKSHSIINILEDYLFFPVTRVGETSIKQLTIANNGSSSLEINDIVISDAAYNIEFRDTIVIEPDSIKTLSISFSPDDTVSYKSIVKIFSSASNETVSNIYLSGKGVGIPYIYNERDSLAFNSANNFRDSLLIINSGTADLKIDSITVPAFVAITATPEFYLKPGDSTFIQIFIDSDHPLYSRNFVDSLLIFSNDPYDSTLKIIIIGEKNLAITNMEQTEQEFSILHQNYPNPFNPSTTISFTIKTPSHVTLKVYDALAREITELLDNDFSAGIHNVVFNGDNLSTGVYYYKIEVKNGSGSAKDYVDVRKMILVK